MRQGKPESLAMMKRFFLAKEKKKGDSRGKK